MKKLLIIAALIACSGCAGMRTSNGTFTAHAECFRIIGFPIPADDEQAAYNLVPKGSKITNVSNTPADWTSFWGGLFNIIGFHTTEIGGTTK